MRTLADFVSAGKVRYIGVANHVAWRVALALGVSERYGYPSFVAYQGLWNLLARDAEDEILPLCRDRSIGFLAWGPLAGGLLSGKYRRGRERPAGSRLGEAGSSYFRIDEEHAYDVVDGHRRDRRTARRDCRAGGARVAAGAARAGLRRRRRPRSRPAGRERRRGRARARARRARGAGRAVTAPPALAAVAPGVAGTLADGRVILNELTLDTEQLYIHAQHRKPGGDGGGR